MSRLYDLSMRFFCGSSVVFYRWYIFVYRSKKKFYLKKYLKLKRKISLGRY